MTRLRTYLLAAAAAIFCALPAQAQSYCDNQATGLRLPLPNYNMPFHQWGTCSRNTFLLLNSSAPANSTTSVHTANWLQVQRISGLSTGTANIWVSSPTIFSVATAPFNNAFVVISSGSLLVQSTSPTSAHPVFVVRDNAGSSALRVLQDGSVNLSSGIVASSGTFSGAGGVGVTYGVSAGSASIGGGLTASSGTFTASGNTQYSLKLSSGIDASDGCIKLKNGTICGPSAGAGDVTQAGGGAFGNSAAVSFAHEDVITSSHPCRVLKSSMTVNVPETTSVATVLGVSMTGSTLTITGVNTGSFARACAFFQLSKNNNNGTGIFGVGAIIGNGSTSELIGPTASTSRPLWGFKGLANATTFPYVGGQCYTHPTALTAGTLTISFPLMSTNASDTVTMYGGTNATNWFTLQEVTCKD